MLLAAESSSGGAGLIIFLPLVLMLVFLWFVMSRQSRSRKQAQRDVQQSLTPGVEVMTTAGLIGYVVALDDETVTIEVAPGVTNRYVRAAIGKIITPDQEPVGDDGESDRTIELEDEQDEQDEQGQDVSDETGSRGTTGRTAG